MKVRIRNEKPTAAQLKALEQECVRIFDKHLETYNKESVLKILHILHFKFGFGQKRLKQFSDYFEEMQIKTIEKYMVEEREVPDICEIQLRESGINLEEFLK